MTVLEAILVVIAGVWAGTINTVVGSGTLVTFPVLLAIGYSPVVANVSNTIGLVPGSVSGAIGYRRELRGQRDRLLRFGAMTFLGAITGAVLLLVLPASAFKGIVPFFIVIALVLIVLQPRLGGWIAQRRPHGAEHHVGLLLGIYATGVYGGYFGAAQGIILIAMLGVAVNDDLQRLNGLKNVLAGLANLVAGVIFIFVADVAWGPVVLIACGSIVGGQLGARYGRRLSPSALRIVIVAVGVFAIVRLLAF
ncbi:sulfite exporter TauE/SafE family protein [Capillimicrobium parvum]|uniref:Probable membrane transporter protein n=1 Tax=Capillimicrobium parvum TaxID=2884022 RepID=A0A9E7C319_9ACTN|nr:sulfite exporter TauE/SafE family protein [Capillimicrobium parvum]UGS38187.1 putative membrane transporter protein YfcA [Capillimicrobium parvum]